MLGRRSRCPVLVRLAAVDAPRVGRLAVRALAAPFQGVGAIARVYSGYRTYSLEWSGKSSDGKTTYTWRINGRQTYKYRTAAPSAKHELILSQLTSDYELPRLPRSWKAGTMKVDWVKAWNCLLYTSDA